MSTINKLCDAYKHPWSIIFSGALIPVLNLEVGGHKSYRQVVELAMKKSDEPVTLTDASKGKGRGILTFSFLLHAALFAYWIFVHVHEASLMAIAESFAKGQRRFAINMLEFPGRWKYLTLVNMVCYVTSRDTYFIQLSLCSACRQFSFVCPLLAIFYQVEESRKYLGGFLI